MMSLPTKYFTTKPAVVNVRFRSMARSSYNRSMALSAPGGDIEDAATPSFQTESPHQFVRQPR